MPGEERSERRDEVCSPFSCLYFRDSPISGTVASRRISADSPCLDSDSSNVDLDIAIGDTDLAAHDSIVGSPAVIKDYSRSTSDIIAEDKSC